MSTIFRQLYLRTWLNTQAETAMELEVTLEEASAWLIKQSLRDNRDRDICVRPGLTKIKSMSQCCMYGDWNYLNSTCQQDTKYFQQELNGPVENNHRSQFKVIYKCYPQVWYIPKRPSVPMDLSPLRLVIKMSGLREICQVEESYVTSSSRMESGCQDGLLNDCWVCNMGVMETWTAMFPVSSVLFTVLSLYVKRVTVEGGRLY